MRLDRDKLDFLILARAAARAGKPTTRAALIKDVGAFVEHELSPGEWKTYAEAAVGRLRGQGLLEADALTATEAGQRRVRERLGAHELPQWKTLKGRVLIALALGHAPASERVQRRLGDADGVRAMVLASRHRVGADEAPTLGNVIDGLVWRQLGVETDQRLTLKRVRELLLARTIGASESLGLKKLAKLAAAGAVGATRPDPDGLRTAAIRNWLAGKGSDGTANTTMPRAASGAARPSLEELAKHVRAAARATRDGRFGDRKVFISAVWRALRTDLEPRGLDETRFKEALVAANRAGLLTLHRADLVAAMDPAEVAASEIHHLNATFHFVETEPV